MKTRLLFSACAQIFSGDHPLSEMTSYKMLFFVTNMASGNTLAGYKVGEISQALLSKQKKSRTDKKENNELNALFSSPSLIQPQFVTVTTKVSKKAAEPTHKKQDGNEDSQHTWKQTEGKGGAFSRLARKRKVPTSDDEGEEALLKKSQKKNKKSNEAVEDPERLARTVFVGNLPVAFTRKKLKQLFAIYGEIESVRFRSAALAKPDLSRKVAMKKKELHSDRHNINGYVVFKEKDCAVKSLRSNGMEVDGFHIRVDLTGQNNKHDHSRSIFVGNLPFDTEEELLRQTFVDCGDIEAVRIVRDSKTGAGKGFGFILFKQKESVMFALKKNKTEFCGRSLRIFPSSENPQQGPSRDVKKGRPKAFAFSGITAKQGMKNELKGKKNQRYGKGNKQGNQGFGSRPVKNQKFQKHENNKLSNPRNKDNRARKIPKNRFKQNDRYSKRGKPSR